MKSDIAIQVENLSKVFQLRHPRVDEEGSIIHEHWALKDVSFEIKKGESVGIIGPNGSGKSTLLQILAGVTKPTTGTVQIRGKVASILDIGAGFHPELSGRENVFLNGKIHGFTKKEIEDKFDEIVAFSGIEKFIDEPVKNYSNGMYLRLAFSIMANLDFDVYLFDEVLSVGDLKFRNKVNIQIQELLNNKNKSILIISHNMKEVNDWCYSFYDMLKKEKLPYLVLETEKHVPFNIHVKDHSLDSGSYSIKHVGFKNKLGEYSGIYEYNDEITFVVDVLNDNQSKTFPYLFNIVDSNNNSIITTSYLLQQMNYILSSGNKVRMDVILPAQFFNEGNFYLNLFHVEDGNVKPIKDKVIRFTVVHEKKTKLYWTNRIPTGILLPLKWNIHD